MANCLLARVIGNCLYADAALYDNGAESAKTAYRLEYLDKDSMYSFYVVINTEDGL